jgi:hypothetical protein
MSILSCDPRWVKFLYFDHTKCRYEVLWLLKLNILILFNRSRLGLSKIVSSSPWLHHFWPFKQLWIPVARERNKIRYFLKDFNICRILFVPNFRCSFILLVLWLKSWIKIFSCRRILFYKECQREWFIWNEFANDYFKRHNNSKQQFDVKNDVWITCIRFIVSRKTPYLGLGTTRTMSKKTESSGRRWIILSIKTRITRVFFAECV